MQDRPQVDRRVVQVLLAGLDPRGVEQFLEQADLLVRTAATGLGYPE